jgi:hypothetical protein
VSAVPDLPSDDLPRRGFPQETGSDADDSVGVVRDPDPAAGGPLSKQSGWEMPDQGIWLTASAWLSPELLSSGAVVAGFGQGGVLDQLEPGPVLDTFTAEAVGGIAGTGVIDLAGRTIHPGDASSPAQSASSPTQSAEISGLAPPDEVLSQPYCAAPELMRLSDDELTGVIRSWRKQASRAQAGELAAVAELAARRRAEAIASGERDSLAADAANDEIAAALTLTGRAAQVLTDRARTMQELPRTLTALAAGRIDMPKALVLLGGLAGQDPALARAVEAQVIDRAAEQTTGQLRATLNRVLLAADPTGADKRRQAEEKQARIEQMPEPGGLTGTLTGRYLPVTVTVAAWNRITALARQLRKAGAAGTLDELRVHVYLALLTGQAAANPGPTDGTDTSHRAAASPQGSGSGGANGTDAAAAEATRGTGPDSEPARDAPRTGVDAGQTGGNADATTRDQPAGSLPPADAPPTVPQPAAAQPPVTQPGTGDPGTTNLSPAPNSVPPTPIGLAPPARLTGTVNLTVPLSTLLAFGNSPGELAGFGPVTAHTAREVASAALDSVAVRWCITVTGDDGEAIGHGCARRVRVRPASGSESGLGWAFTIKLSALARIHCGHERESTYYRPPPSLWHLIQIRNQRCTAPGCRMPAARCDDDHTIAFGKGGLTCECNLGPLCRHHHRIKQLRGWRLEQPSPGTFAWVTPSGWKYFTGPASYAA